MTAATAFSPVRSSPQRSAFSPSPPPQRSARRDILQVRGGGGGGGAGDAAVKAFMMGPAAASVLAGSVAGAIGVGVAFPLDTLKTKAQVLSQQQFTARNADGSSTRTTQKITMLQTIALVYKTEGWQGFFGGVKGMMAGQALIKALAFSTNAATLAWLEQQIALTALPPTLLLLTAACTAGFITSFIVAPIERVKVMMQASSAYRDEWHCLSVILETEGWQGLFSRGLGPTLAREIPSYGFYFWTYGFLSTSSGLDFGALSTLIFGATAGMAAWIPVYPIDVVKTLMQNTAGGRGEQESAWAVMRQVYNQGGLGAFFDGLTPKLLRAAVNHATTFTLYDLIMQRLVQ
jgi:hypothetical protein